MRKEKPAGKRRSFSALMEKNSFVMVFSLVIGFLFWCVVSMSQTNEVEKTFQNVPVRLNVEAGSLVNNRLKIYGGEAYTVDVTVKGKSYIVNDSAFADRIAVTPSLTSVSAPGSFNLPLTAVIEGYGASDVTISNLSKTTISVYFDEEVEKTFDVKVKLNESSDFSLAEGYSLETPVAKPAQITYLGPSLEIGRVAEVYATAMISGSVSQTQVLPATLVPVNADGSSDGFRNLLQKENTQVEVTVAVRFTSEYEPTVAFTNAPAGFADAGVPYTVSPESVRLSVSTADAQIINSKKISVGTVDFSQIGNKLNVFTFEAENLPYTFVDDVDSVTVSVDMSDREIRWLEVPVNAGAAELPAGVTVTSESVKSVQVVCPPERLEKLSSADAYAVPVLDGVELKPGEMTVPARIVFPEIPDVWAYDPYGVNTVTIQVAE